MSIAPVPYAALPIAIREGRRMVAKEWAPHRSLQAFLADHFPDRWENIRHCGLTGLPRAWRENTGRPDEQERVKSIAWACEEVPLCIRCTHRRAHRRTKAAMDTFARCTPRGQPLLLTHIVQTAPIYNDGLDPKEGWGVAASNQHDRFAALVYDALKEHFGDGIGVYASYQDFGERAFAKRHPHIDLTLNGWMLKDGKPVQTPRMDIQGRGFDRWHDSIVQRAISFDLKAGRGSLKVMPTVQGHKAYWPILKYQLRELVGFHKLTYSRADQMVWWNDYKDGKRQPFTVDAFLDGLQAYQRRLGGWTRDNQQNLHFRYGHLSDRKIRATQKIMDGDELPHGSRCTCSDCGDWHRIFLADMAEEIGPGTPLQVQA